jgi:putative tryptophan/tyrosine transport system substrate-binding protein
VRRRDFITLLGGAAAAWPLAARAQQGDRMRRIGVLMPAAADDRDAQDRLAAFLQGLQQSGWSVGRNMRIEYSWTSSDADSVRKSAADLVALAPDVILANGSAAMGPLLRATRAVPVVFAAVADPVGAGYVASLARPGGNATGFALYEFGLAGKWLELLKEVVPRATRVAVIRDASVSAGVGQFAAIQSVAPSLGVELTPVDVNESAEIERAVAEFARIPNGGLVVTGSA